MRPSVATAACCRSKSRTCRTVLFPSAPMRVRRRLGVRQQLRAWLGSSSTFCRKTESIAESSVGRRRVRRPRRSAQVCELLALDELEVDPRADAGRFGTAGKPILADLDVLDQPVLMRAVRQQHLEIRGVADRAGEVQLRQVVERIAAVM